MCRNWDDEQFKETGRINKHTLGYIINIIPPFIEKNVA